MAVYLRVINEPEIEAIEKHGRYSLTTSDRSTWPVFLHNNNVYTQ